jgi:ketosteroid isomerase-like protein
MAAAKPAAAVQSASAAKPAAAARPVAAANAAADRTPDGAVRAFNAALSERHLDEALALLVPGAVTFHLEPAHAFAAPRPGEATPLTSDLTAHWRTVAPLLYSTHRVYLRQVDEATVHADGRLAMVWARVRTRSEPHRGTPSLLVFSETYLLRLDDGHWRIAGVAQSRSTR